jgi:hypothetical protein
VALFAFGALFGSYFQVIEAGPDLRTTEFTCQPRGFAVESSLPIMRLMRATRKGQSKLAAEKEYFVGRFFSLQFMNGGIPYRKGIT